MKILVAIDETESSHKALRQALRLITHEGTTFVLLGVEKPMFVPPTSTATIPGVLGEDSSIAWQEEVNLAQIEKQRTTTALEWAENLCQDAGVQSITRSEFGEPKQIICDIAAQENCDLVVVGSHAYGVIDRVLIGSVSDHVVHHVHCPVLVVRE